MIYTFFSTCRAEFTLAKRAPSDENQGAAKEVEEIDRKNKMPRWRFKYANRSNNPYLWGGLYVN